MEHNVKSFKQKSAKCWWCQNRYQLKNMIKCVDCCAFVCQGCVSESMHRDSHHN